MKVVQGNLLDLAETGVFDVIAHGCNCHNSMGAGIAQFVAQRWPQAQHADAVTERGDINKLGTISSTKAWVQDGQQITILNLYTQYDGGRDLSYTALRLCLQKIAMMYMGKRIGLPRIGSGIAGGNWIVIQQMIIEELEGCEVTIVELKENELRG